MKMRKIAHIVLPAALLYWPFLVFRYVLEGPASAEVKMIAGVKEVFNRGLASFEFLRWNDFIETGSPFHVFGATPFSLLTPLEMALNAVPASNRIAGLVVASVILCSALVHWLVEDAKFDTGTGAGKGAKWALTAGVCFYFLVEPVQLLSSFPFCHNPAIITLPVLVALFSLYLDGRRDSHLVWYWIIAFFMTVGSKPEMIFMFVLAAGLTVVSWHIFGKRNPRSLRRMFIDGVLLAVVPFGFYVWQLPLLASVFSVSTHRLTRLTETATEAFGNVGLALGYSNSLRVAIVGALLSALILRWKGVKSSTWDLLRTGLVCGALYSAFFETMLLKTGEAPVQTSVNLSLSVLSYPFGILIAGIALFGAHQQWSLTFFRPMIAFLICGWVLREFLVFPLYSFFGFTYANPRDLVFFAAIPMWFLISGLSKLWTEKSGLSRWVARTVVAGLLISSFFSYVVSPGKVTENVTWTRASLDNVRERARIRDEMIQDYDRIVQESRGFARAVTMENTFVGQPGHLAGAGVREAWGYAFTSDHWLELGNLAFRRNLAPYPFPRPYAYSVTTRRVYNHRLPHLKSIDLWEHYGNDLYPKTAAFRSPDPFYLELMRVGLIWRLYDMKLDPVPGISLVRESGPVLTYRFSPARGLERFGFLPALPESVSDYDKTAFRGRALSELGIRVEQAEFKPERHHLRIHSDRMAALVVFDSWHPFWRVKVNGVPEKIERVFINFRGVRLQPGVNDVVFTYELPYQALALLGSLTTLGASFGWIAMRRRKGFRSP